MAYKMEYGMGSPIVLSTKNVKRKGKVGIKKLLLVCIIVALIVLCATTDIFIPGDKEITKAAMNNLVNDVKGGEQVVDAFAAFCQTVLQGG